MIEISMAECRWFSLCLVVGNPEVAYGCKVIKSSEGVWSGNKNENYHKIKERQILEKYRVLESSWSK